MTYAQGSLVQTTDYNGFANTNTPNVNEIWGAGSGSSGYGQTAVPTVATGSTLGAAQWDTLFNAINKAAQHQSVAVNHVTLLPLPAAGQTVAYNSSVLSNIQAIYDTRLNCLSSGTDVVASATRTDDWGAGNGIPTVSSTITWTFGSYDQLRYFFNCGGRLRITTSSAVGSGTPDDLVWNSMTLGMGALALPAVSTTQIITGSTYNGLTQFNNTITPNTLIADGFYDLTSTPQVLFEQINGSGVYGADTIQISFSTSGATVTATVTFIDANAGVIDGALSVFAVARPGESTYITNTWGTPVINVTAPA